MRVAAVPLLWASLRLRGGESKKTQAFRSPVVFLIDAFARDSNPKSSRQQATHSKIRGRYSSQRTPLTPPHPQRHHYAPPGPSFAGELLISLFFAHVGFFSCPFGRLQQRRCSKKAAARRKSSSSRSELHQVDQVRCQYPSTLGLLYVGWICFLGAHALSPSTFGGRSGGRGEVAGCTVAWTAAAG